MKISLKFIKYFTLLNVLIFGLISNFILNVTLAANQSASDELNQLLHSIKSMQADFIQTVSDNHGKVIQKSYGRIALQRPGKFRWEVTKPIPQLIVAFDDKLWIYDRDLEQVTIRSLGKAAGDAPALLLSQENAALENNYNIQSLQKNNSDGLRWFSFTPKNTQRAMLTSTEMAFANQMIREMKLKDNLGHVTSIKFQQVKTNIDLPKSLFVFKTPKGVDIIDETNRQKR